MSLQISALIEMAKEPSSEKRRQLLREITDVFMLAPESVSQAEMELYDEVLSHLTTEMEVAVRAELKARITYVPFPSVKRSPKPYPASLSIAVMIKPYTPYYQMTAHACRVRPLSRSLPVPRPIRTCMRSWWPARICQLTSKTKCISSSKRGCVSVSWRKMPARTRP